MENKVEDKERVARILSRDWFVDGRLLHVAFALNHGETYLSVNRMSVSSFPSDVKSFVETHPNYVFGDTLDEYCSAILSVRDIRQINVEYKGEKLDVDIEVEPRDTHTKSHAGIFTRYQNKNVKKGGMLTINHSDEVASDVILLKVQMSLLRQSIVEKSKL
jgi:hypothetical protein